MIIFCYYGLTREKKKLIKEIQRFKTLYLVLGEGAAKGSLGILGSVGGRFASLIIFCYNKIKNRSGKALKIEKLKFF